MEIKVVIDDKIMEEAIIFEFFCYYSGRNDRFKRAHQPSKVRKTLSAGKE